MRVLLQPLGDADGDGPTGYRLLLDDWRGVGIAFFALVGVANMYMSIFGRLRVDIKHERVEIAVKEEQLAELNGEDLPPKPAGGR